MKKETKTVEKQIFIACDGKEFENENDCIKYEALLEKEKVYKQALEHISKLEIDYDRKEMPGVIPLDVFVEEDGNIGDVKRKLNKDTYGKHYHFYKLNNKTDAEMLALVMANKDNAKTEPIEILRKSGKITFPCIVMYSRSYGWGRKICTFDKEMELIKKYCKLHGYDIELTKIKDKS